MDKLLKLLNSRMSFAEEGAGGTEPSGQGDDQVNEVSEDELDDDSWVAKRTAKNVREELKRKNEELQKLKFELEESKKVVIHPKPKEVIDTQKLPADIKYPPEIQEYHDEIIAMGVDPKFAKLNCDTMFKVAVNAADARASLKVKPFEKMQTRYQTESLKEVVDSFERSPEHKFIVGKYKNEIIDYVKKNFTADYWDDVNVITSAIGIITGQHLKELGIGTEEPISVKNKVNETQNNASMGQGGINQDEFQEWADERGFMTNTPDLKKKTKEAYLAWKRAQERK